MDDTVVSPSPAQAPRVAIGYDGDRPEPPLVTAPFLGGGGALRSTGDDMVRFLRALATRAAPRELVRAIERTEVKTFTGHPPERHIGLGWFISVGQAHFLIKNGSGSGFSTLLAYAPARRIGLFAAANRHVEGLFEREFVAWLDPPRVAPAPAHA
jgi:CubicO group peptidase (beta-lactamase class C family)